MKLRKFCGIALILPSFAACAMEGGEEDTAFSTQSDALVLMDKPGTDAANFTEAGRDIAQKGAYTFYGADTDSNVTGLLHGSAHLFKNNVPLRSYAATTSHPGTRFGTLVAMSENWLAARIRNLPLAPNLLADTVLLVGKNGSGEFESCGPLGPNGEIPNCVTCTVYPDGGEGLPDYQRMGCSGVPQITLVRPGAFTANEELLGMSLVGNELVVTSSKKLVRMVWDGVYWNQSSISVPSNETLIGPVSQSENRLAFSVTHNNGSRYVNIYQRANTLSPWAFSFRVHPLLGDASSFGSKLELSGNSLLVTDGSNVHFIDLKTVPTNADAGAHRSCVVPVTAYDVAVSGSNAVIATFSGLPMTFGRGPSWQFHGGLPSGLFPRNLNSGGSSTLASLWGVAVDGDEVAIGWRNHVRTDPYKATGAALGFGFDDYDCGALRTLPNGSSARVKQLTPVSVTAPAYQQYPVTNAIDGSSSTRWMASQTPGTTLAFDLGELRMLHHLEIEWGTTYASNFTVQVTENGTTWIDIATLTGSGGTQVIDLKNNAQAFGKGVRLRLNSMQVTPGTGDWGVAVKEARIYRRVHDACGPTAPVPLCTGAGPSHVCNTACGGFYSAGSCYCDQQCEQFGDCCSFDGAHRGAQYQGGVDAVCGY